MEITRVKIALSDDERIKAYATITIDHCFVIQGLILTHSQKKGYFLFMPGRKRADCTYVDIVHPLSVLQFNPTTNLGFPPSKNPVSFLP
jgi:stage V sporulation protein G